MAIHLITQQVIVLGTVAGTVESVGHVALWRNCQCILVIHGVRDFIVLITSQVPVSLLTVYCVTFINCHSASCCPLAMAELLVNLISVH